MANAGLLGGGCYVTGGVKLGAWACKFRRESGLLLVWLMRVMGSKSREGGLTDLDPNDGAALSINPSTKTPAESEESLSFLAGFCPTGNNSGTGDPCPNSL